MTSPSQITIKPVCSSRELSLFKKLPRLLYSKLPGYVPPLDLEQDYTFSPKKASFFEHGFACYFIAYQNHKPIGRISAQIDAFTLKKDKVRTGFFGSLDTVTPECVPPLLKAAENWLRVRDIERIRGPWTLNSNGQSGIMIEGQEEMPMVGIPWHPKDLAQWVEDAGYSKVTDLLSYRIVTGRATERANRVPGNLQRRLGNIKMRGMRLHKRQETMEDLEILRSIFNDAWSDSWGSIPLTSHEVYGFFKALKPVLRPEQYVLAEIDGEPAAIAMVIPNMYDIGGDLNGASTIREKIVLGARILDHAFCSARVVLLGVRKKYLGTALRAILPVMLIDELLKRGHVLPYRTIELGWILESHDGMRKLIERIAPQPYKKHRMFEKYVTPQKS